MNARINPRTAVLLLLLFLPLLFGGKSTNVYDLCVDHVEYRLTGESTWRSSTSTVSVPAGAQVEFRAVPNREGSPNWPNRINIWWSGGGLDVSAPDRASRAFPYVSTSVDAPQIVNSTAGAVTKSLHILTCGVGGLKYRFNSSDPFQDVPDPLYVAVNQSVEFEAVIEPAGAAWPAGEPHWTGATASAAAGRATAVFNTPSADAADLKHVSVACGTSTLTANIFVVDGLILMPEQPMVSVERTLVVHAKKAEGGQLVDANCDWSIVTGGASIGFDGGATGVSSITLQATDTPGHVTISATETGGSACAQCDLTVIRIHIDYRIAGEASWQPAPAPLYIGKGTELEFRAGLEPAGTDWPDGKPEWTGADPKPDTATEAVRTFSTASSSNDSPYEIRAEAYPTAIGGIEIIAFELHAMEYKIGLQGDYEAAPDPLCIAAGSGPVYFRVRRSPDDIPWTALNTCWTGATVIAGSPGEAQQTFSTDYDTVQNYPDVRFSCENLSAAIKAGKVSIEEIRVRQPGAAEFVPATDPTFVPVGAEFTLRAVPHPADAEFQQPFEWIDNATGVRIGVEPDLSKTISAVSSSTLSPTVIVARIGTSSASTNLVACGIARLSWKKDGAAAYSPVNGLITLVPGDTCRFKAEIAPSGATWPGGVPLWTDPNGDALDPVDPAHPEEVSYTFGVAAGDPSDPMTWLRVTASCGASAMDAPVVVLGGFQVMPEWPSVAKGDSLAVTAYFDGQEVDCDWSVVAGQDKAVITGAVSGVPSVTLLGNNASSSVGDVEIEAIRDGQSAVARITVVDLADATCKLRTVERSYTDDETLVISRGSSAVFRADAGIPAGAVAFVWPRGTPAWSGLFTAVATSQTIRLLTVSSTPAGSDLTVQCGSDRTAHVVTCDLDALELTNNNAPGNTVIDGTPEIEDLDASTLLCLGYAEPDDAPDAHEAAMSVDLSFKPGKGAGGALPTGEEVRWRITGLDGGAVSEWTPDHGTAETTPASTVWDGSGDGWYKVTASFDPGCTSSAPEANPTRERYVVVVHTDLHADMNRDGKVDDDDPQETGDGLIINMNEGPVAVAVTLGPDNLQYGSVTLELLGAKGAELEVWTDKTMPDTDADGDGHPDALLIGSGAGDLAKTWTLGQVLPGGHKVQLEDVPATVWLVAAGGAPSGDISDAALKITYKDAAAHEICTDTLPVTIAWIDLRVQSLPDEPFPENETDPGAFVRVNDNDNDGLPAPGNADVPREDCQTPIDRCPVPNPDPDLERVTITVLPTFLLTRPGSKLTIEVGASFRIWSDRTKQIFSGTGVTVDADSAGCPVKVAWDTGSGVGIPTDVYVEGTAVGSADLHLSFDPGGDQGVLDDTVKITAVKVDVTFQDLPEFSNAPDPNEDDPGGFIGINDNDDCCGPNDVPLPSGGNGTPDLDDNTPVTPADPDLHPITFAMDPVPHYGTVTVDEGWPVTELWTTQTKDAQVNDSSPVQDYDLSDGAQRQKFIDHVLGVRYIEGAVPGVDAVKLEYSLPGVGVIASDQVKVTVVDVALQGLSPGDVTWAAHPAVPPGTVQVTASVSPAGRLLKWELLNDTTGACFDTGAGTTDGPITTTQTTMIVVAGDVGGRVDVRVSDAVIGAQYASGTVTAVKMGLATLKGLVCNRQITVSADTPAYGSSAVTVKGYNWLAETLTASATPVLDHHGNTVQLQWTLMTAGCGSFAQSVTDPGTNLFTATAGTTPNTAMIGLRLHLAAAGPVCVSAPVRIVQPYDNWSTSATTGQGTVRTVAWWTAIAASPVVTGQPSIRLNNNCYSFACNTSRDYYVCGGAQPVGGISQPVTVDKLRAAAQSDKLVFLLGKGTAWAVITDAFAVNVLRRMETAMTTGSGGHLVYGVVDTGTDYHWFRLEKDGTWSQKHGMCLTETGAVDPRTTGTRTVKDSNGNVRCTYTADAGFFWVEPGTATLGPTQEDASKVVRSYPASYIVQNGYNPYTNLPAATRSDDFVCVPRTLDAQGNALTWWLFTVQEADAKFR